MNYFNLGLTLYLLIGIVFAYYLIYKSSNFDEELVKFSAENRVPVYGRMVWFALFALFWIIILPSMKVRRIKQ